MSDDGKMILFSDDFVIEIRKRSTPTTQGFNRGRSNKDEINLLLAIGEKNKEGERFTKLTLLPRKRHV